MVPCEGRSTLSIRSMLRRGLRQRRAVVEVDWPKVANSDRHSWDMHTDFPKRIEGEAAPMLDAGLSSLLDDMDARGLLDETLALAVGEFCRAPQRGVSTLGNGNSADGRDHWPYCFTAMIAGAGIIGNQVDGTRFNGFLRKTGRALVTLVARST
ncbi:MAG: DUF1501 domain-containing protein [Thermoguttaceae bacterium]|nr:DUF1501 domain-containing protein [Thermoguttaceae bacterium]